MWGGVNSGMGTGSRSFAWAGEGERVRREERGEVEDSKLEELSSSLSPLSSRHLFSLIVNLSPRQRAQSHEITVVL